MVCYFGNNVLALKTDSLESNKISSVFFLPKTHTGMHTYTHAHTHKEFNLETIIGAQRRTGKSYCYNAQIINHPDILLALSLYIPLK